MTQLECKDLSVGYNHMAVKNNINFQINEGDYLCIIGSNGSGKSTLMKTILGLLQPVSGSIIIDNDTKKAGIGYLPQQTEAQKDFPASVMEIVLSGFQAKLGIRPFYNKEEKKKALEIIQNLGLNDIAKKSYQQLSGGQKQRVLLARALCATDKILLLDEPVSGLDPQATAEMYKTIAELNKKGTSIIMISHNMEDVLPYASHILDMGKNYYFGKSENYKKEKE